MTTYPAMASLSAQTQQGRLRVKAPMLLVSRQTESMFLAASGAKGDLKWQLLGGQLVPGLDELLVELRTNNPLKSRTALIRPCSRTASAIWMRGWSDGHGFTASSSYNILPFGWLGYES